MSRNLQKPKDHPFKPDDELLLRVVKEWSATFDAITDFVSVHDTEFRIARCNKALADFVGATPKELIGRKCYELIHGTDAPIEGCPHAKALETQMPEAHEVMVGDTCLHVSCSPYLDQAGKLIGSVHIARDITAQKRADDEKNELLAKLQEAMANVKILSGMLPICSYCYKIRDDEGYWLKFEAFLSTHSDAHFSHGVCPNCMPKARKDLGLNK